MGNFKWEGVFPAVTTKFKADETIDFDLFGKNVEAQIQAGVNGIVLGGTLGESGVLTQSEKFELVKETVKISGGRVPVLMNVAEQRTNDAINFMAESAKAGADGFMMLPPLRYVSDERETLQYIEKAARSTELPIMIYNNPIDYKTEITLPMFDVLEKHANIQAVKESTRDISNTTRMLNRYGDRFKILSGVDTMAMESLVMGAHGWVAGLVCAFPKETVTIFKLIKAGRIDEARKIYQWFLPLLELDIHTKLVQYIKMAETLTDLGSEYVREPRLTLVGEERTRVIGIIEKALACRPELPLVDNIASEIIH
jgi:1-pyrroline-4-hydroxy-2-carboxylate deaminase